MKKIKEWLTDFFREKKHIYITIFTCVMILVLLIGLIIFVKVTKRYSNSQVESLMVSSAKSYLKAHKDVRPTKDNPIYIVDTNSLVNEDYLKEFDKITKNTGCHGYVTVIYNNGEIRYEPKLDCNEYVTKSIKDSILDKEDVVTDGDGLYKVNNNYIYKGDYVNNYLSFADKLWRIFKITEDGRIFLILDDVINDKNSALVFDDRYNEEAKGIRGYNNFDTSRIKVFLNEIYNNDFKDYYAYLLNYDACIHTRSESDTDMTGAIECFSTTSTPIGLMAVYDYLNGSRDRLCINTMMSNCMNYNYLSKASSKWWLMNGSNVRSYKVYSVNDKGQLLLDDANAKKNLRYVINISGNNIYKDGDGTKDSPYTIRTY